jgi:hypothetical protein
MIEQACSAEMNLVKARVAALGLDASLLDRLKSARWTELSGYLTSTSDEGRRDRAARQAAVATAAECDLLVLVVDGRQPDHAADAAFAQAWDRWFQEHPQHEVSPALVLVTGIDRPEFGGAWKPTSPSTTDLAFREPLIRARLDALRALLPPTFHDFVAIGLGDETSFAVIEHLVLALAPLLLKAERTALIRRLNDVAGRSRVGRLVKQLGQHGRSLWGSLKARHHAATPPRSSVARK